MTLHPRLSCSDYSFPALGLEQRLRLISLLGFGQADLGLFLVSRQDEDRFAADPAGTAGRFRNGLEQAGLRPADLFLIVGGDDFASGASNGPEPDRRARLRAIFELALDVAAAIGVGSLTVLPGIAGVPDAWPRAAGELAWRAERAGERGIELRIEPHVGSLVPTPELAGQLAAAVGGLRLSLDPGHFVFQDIGLNRVLPLAPLAAHVHLSGARPDAMHVPPGRSTWDMARLVGELEDQGYQGSYCIEYVPMAKWGADATDVVSATAETAAQLSELLDNSGKEVRPRAT